MKSINLLLAYPAALFSNFIGCGLYMFSGIDFLIN